MSDSRKVWPEDDIRLVQIRLFFIVTSGEISEQKLSEKLKEKPAFE